MSQIVFSVLWVLLTGLWDFQDTVFPRIIAGDDYHFFAQKEGDYSIIILNIAHWQTKIFCFFPH